MKKDLRIAVSGKSGCGNTTVSKMLADALDLTFINFTFRCLAKERSVDLNTIIELAEKDDSIDREVDPRQVQLALDSGGCVLASRLAIWMLKAADLKIYLNAAAQTRAGRIFNREGGSIEIVAAFTADRDKKDRDRYLRIYDINFDDYSFADLIIETDNLTPQEIVDIILKRIKAMNDKGN